MLMGSGGKDKFRAVLPDYLRQFIDLYLKGFCTIFLSQVGIQHFLSGYVWGITTAKYFKSKCILQDRL